MSKGLGCVQRKVITALKYCKKKDSGSLVYRAKDLELAKQEPGAEIKTSEFNGYKFVDVELAQKDGWQSVLDVVYYVVQGNHCFETNEPCDLPTIAQKQSVWRAIRVLQKKGLVTTQRVSLSARENLGIRGLTIERIIKLC